MSKIREIYKIVSKHSKEKRKLQKKIYHLNKKCKSLTSNVVDLKNNLAQLTHKSKKSETDVKVSSNQETPNHVNTLLLLLLMMIISYIFLEILAYINLPHELIPMNMLAVHSMIFMIYLLN
jgi:hypothetical protein